MKIKRAASVLLLTAVLSSTGAGVANAHQPGATAQTGTSAYCSDATNSTLNLRGTLRFHKTSTTTKATGEHRHNGVVQARVVRDGKVSWVNGVRKSVVCRKAFRTVLAGVAWKIRVVPTTTVTPTSITLPSAELEHGDK